MVPFSSKAYEKAHIKCFENLKHEQNEFLHKSICMQYPIDFNSTVYIQIMFYE